MASMNACNFTGRLGGDPELRTVNGDRSVCSFSLAVDGYGRNAETLWLDVSVWGAQGENAHRYLSKGREVAVSGRVGVRAFTRRNGEPGAAVTLDARDVTFIGGRGDDAPAQAPRGDVPNDTAPAQAQAQAFQGDDDIPF